MSFGLLKKSKPEKVQRRSQESPLRREQRRQERDEEVEDYYSGGSRISNRPHRRPRRDREARDRKDDNINGLKLKIPQFHGKNDPDVYLEWEKKTELVFACQNYSEFIKVRVAATNFCDYAINWWDQLVTNRRKNSEYPIDSWAKMKSVMRRRFVPSHYQLELHQKCCRLSQGKQGVEDYFQELKTHMIRANIVEDQKAMVPRDDGELGTEEEIESKEAEVVFDSLSSSEKKEEAMKQSLGSIDDSADEFTERYSIMSTPDSNTLEFKVVEEVDFVFGDSAFSKPGNKVTSLLAEIMKTNREKQLPHFKLSKTEPIRNIEGEKHRDFKLFIGREVASTTLVKNMSVQTRRYSKPYELEWLNDNGEVKATKQVLISFCIEKYEEEVVESDSVLKVEEGCVELPIKENLLVARRSLSLNAKANEQEQKGNLFHTRCLLRGKVCSLIIDGRRVIKVPKVSYLKLMEDLSYPFDPGTQI